MVIYDVISLHNQVWNNDTHISTVLHFKYAIFIFCSETKCGKYIKIRNVTPMK